MVTLKSAYVGATLNGSSLSEIEAEVMQSEEVSVTLKKAIDKKFNLSKAANSGTQQSYVGAQEVI